MQDGCVSFQYASTGSPEFPLGPPASSSGGIEAQLKLGVDGLPPVGRAKNYNAMNVLSGLTMIRITAEHIYVLRNSTGKPFTDLIDRLIRSSAATLGIARSAVFDNPRTNYPDGGVDTQVTAGAQLDPRAYFNGPSTWQYKAVALKDFIDSKVKGEINGDSKDYVRSLLKKGYAYRLCIADDGPAERKTEIKALLDSEIKTVNPEAPESIVLRLGSRWMGEHVSCYRGGHVGFFYEGLLSLRDLAEPGTRLH